jgi:hypothetical protein
LQGRTFGTPAPVVDAMPVAALAATALATAFGFTDPVAVGHGEIGQTGQRVLIAWPAAFGGFRFVERR